MDYYASIIYIDDPNFIEYAYVMQREGRINSAEKRSLILRDRQVAKKCFPQHSEQNWLRKVSLGILVFTAFIWGLKKITSPQIFPVKLIKIQGSFSHISQQTLHQIVLPFSQTGFFHFDTQKLSDRLLQLPWIATVKIKQKWPDTIIISLTEQTPIARFNNNKTLLNNQGDLFNLNTLDESNIMHLPLFIGPEAQRKQMLASYLSMNRIFSNLSLSVTTLVLNAQQLWKVRLNNGLIIFIGRIDPLARLQRFSKIYSLIIGNNQNTPINYVDLRYAHGVVVNRKD